MNTLPRNLIDRFFSFAHAQPTKVALIEPVQWSADGILHERMWTFAQIADLTQVFQKRFDQQGFIPGQRVLILLPISARMYALVAACFANGLIPVFIDHTLPRKTFLQALKKAAPNAVFSTDKLFKYRFLLPALWRSRLYALDESGFALKDWEKIPFASSTDFRSPTACDPESESLITWTSGSTGAPKAADRKFKLLFHQREISHALWSTGEDAVEMTMFPLVVLTNLTFGLTSVLPALDFNNLAQASARVLAEQVRRHCVNRMVAPPSVLNLLTKAGLQNEFHRIQALVTGGAPVPNWLMRRTQKLFANSRNSLVYGSTEAEPIAFAHFDEVIGAEGAGYMVGRPIGDIELRLMPALKGLPGLDFIEPELSTTDAPGEAIVSGPHVVRRYLFAGEENRRSKLPGRDGRVWHRTGDTGYFDSQERFWLLGRLNDRLPGNEIDVYPFEHALENQLEKRAALIATAQGAPAVFIENPENDSRLKELALAFMDAKNIRGRLLSVDSMPVDRRHFWKIDREALKRRL